MWIFPTFKGGDGPDGRGTESRKQTKQENDEDNEREAEEKHTPVGGKGEARRVVGRIDEAEHKGRRPRRKECAEDGSQESQQRALAQDELDEATTAGADRDAESHLMGAGRSLRGHHVGDVDAGDEQNESDQKTEDAEESTIVLLEIGDAGTGGIEGERLIEKAVDIHPGHAAEALGTFRFEGATDCREVLAERLGPTMGPWFRRLGRGVDSSPVDATPWVARGHGRETTFQQNQSDWDAVADAVRALG